MVDVTDGADVDVRLGPLELRLRHWMVLLDFYRYAMPTAVLPLWPSWRFFMVCVRTP
jgi:hypothetical protein